MSAPAAEATTYEIEGRLLEVCTCNTLCPCWVGEDPDGGTCDSVLAWYVDRGQVQGVDVSDRGIALSVHIPGNVFDGNWKAVVYLDDRCTEEQQAGLLKVFTGELGGAIADLAVLVGEVVTVERVSMTFTVRGGEGTLKLGDAAEARLSPFRGATGETTALHDTVFTTVPGSPAFPGKAELFRRSGRKHGLSDLDISGNNAIQASFRFAA